MGTSTVASLIVAYKYPLLFPIAMVEGHGISLLSGFLSHLGYLNPLLAGIVIALGNLLGDIALYWLGYYKGKPFIGKFGHYMGITEERFQKASELFHEHKSWVLFVSKVTNGMGLAMGLLFTAGAVKIPLREYFFWNALGEAVWTGILVAVGYFFGNIYSTVDNILFKGGVIVAGILVIALLFFKIRRHLEEQLLS